MRKKYLFFVGRLHHGLKLKNLINRLGEENDVLVFIAPNSVNIDPTAEFAFRLFGDKVVEATYPRLPTFNKVGDYVKKSSFNHVPPYWQVQGVVEALVLDETMPSLLDKVKPDGIFVLHTNNFWGRLLGHHGRKLGIPVYAFQEGLIRDIDEEKYGKQTLATEDVDAIFAWLPRDAKIYNDIKEGIAIPVGPIHMDGLFGDETSVPQNRTVFCPPEPAQYIGNIERDIAFFKSKDVLRNSFDVRLHPFTSGIIRNTDPTSDFLRYQRIITQHSTSAYEAILMGRLVYEFQEDGIEILQPFSQQGLAISVNKDNFVRRFTSSVPPRLHKFIMENNSYLDNHAVDRVIEFLND